MTQTSLTARQIEALVAYRALFKQIGRSPQREAAAEAIAVALNARIANARQMLKAIEDRGWITADGRPVPGKPNLSTRPVPVGRQSRRRPKAGAAAEAIVKSFKAELVYDEPKSGTAPEPSPEVDAGEAAEPEPPHPDAGRPVITDCHPLDRALGALHGRARLDRAGFVLDGRPVAAKDLVAEANRVLQARNWPLIAYPGVASVERCAA